MNEYQVGSVNEILLVFVQDSTSTTGAGKTGIAYNASGLTAYWCASASTSSNSITLASMATGGLGVYISGGWGEIDSTNMPGWYQFCPPANSLAIGKETSYHFQGAANMVPRPLKVRLWTVNPDSANNAMTGLNGFTATSGGGGGGSQLQSVTGITVTAQPLNNWGVLSTETVLTGAANNLGGNISLPSDGTTSQINIQLYGRRASASDPLESIGSVLGPFTANSNTDISISLRSSYYSVSWKAMNITDSVSRTATIDFTLGSIPSPT
jgi:hypothetical protein